MILNPFIRFDRFEAVNSKTKCSEPWGKPAETCFLCCLEERPEALLKADSIIDFKNMFQGIYTDTRLTLTETVLLSFVADIEHGLLCKSNFTQKQLPRKDMKNKSVRNFWNYQAKMWHSSFIAKQLSAVF